MFKKSLIVGVTVLMTQLQVNGVVDKLPNQNISVHEETKFKNNENIGQKSEENEEFTLFGLYSTSYYKNILKALDGIQKKTIATMTALEKLQENIESQPGTDQIDPEINSENLKKSNSIIENLQNFLTLQEKLDKKNISFLGELGIVIKNDESPDLETLDK